MRKLLSMTTALVFVAMGVGIAQNRFSSPGYTAVSSAWGVRFAAQAVTDGGLLRTGPPGQNRFTKLQARRRLERYGYSQVRDLMQDDEWVWHGKAQHNGRKVFVTLDHEGNIAEE